MNKIIDQCISDYFFNIKEDASCSFSVMGATNCRQCFKNQFFDGNQISYDCDPKRLLYIIRYLPVHVKENYKALDLIKPEVLDDLLKYRTINVVSIGGGPGTDSYAVKQFLIDHAPNGSNKINICLTRIDKESNWDTIAIKLNKEIENTSKLIFEHKKNNMDVTDQNNLRSAHADKFNVFIISYLLSELNDNQIPKLSNYINFSSSKNISLIFINDIETMAVKNKIENLFSLLDSNTSIEKHSNVRWHCGYSYDNQHRDFFEPKLSTNSIRYYKELYL